MAAARDVVAVLAVNPQPSLIGPTVYRPNDGRDWGGGARRTAQQPITYVELRDVFSSMVDVTIGDLREDHRRRRSPRATHRGAFLQRNWGGNGVRVARTVDGTKQWVPMNPQKRDGMGGRKVRRSPYSPDRVLKVFYDLYGDPFVEQRSGGKRLTVWQLDPASDVADVLRLSSEELHGGETLRNQEVYIAKLRERCELAPPRFLVVATLQSGLSDHTDRLDLHWLEERIRAKQIRTVVSREPDRIGRNRTAVGLFYDLLKEERVALYYAHYFGRKVDWANDEFYLDMLHAFASNEAKTIVRRTSSATVNRYLLEGKGWPSSKKFGFERDAEKNLVPVALGMQVVNFICRRYYELAKVGDAGVAAVNEEIKEKFGVYLSDEKVRQILHDAIYVTGEWYVNFFGYRVACNRIQLGEMAVPRHIYQRNQELLAAGKGRVTISEKGEFLLNYRPFLHATCARHREDPPRLRAYRDRGRHAPDFEPFYYHQTNGKHRDMPTECKRFRVPSRLIEATVVTTLRELVRDKHLQKAYAEALILEEHQRSDRPNETELAEARRAVAELTAEVQVMRRHRAGKPGPYEEFTEKQWTVLWELKQEELAEAKDALDEAEARAVVLPAELEAVTAVDEDRFVDAIERVLTVHVPEDPDLRRARVSVYKALVDRVILHTSDAGWFVEIWGPIVPDSVRISSQLSPVRAAIEELRSIERAGLLDNSTWSADDLDEEDGGDVVAAALEAVEQLKSVSDLSKQSDHCLERSELERLIEALRNYEEPPPQLNKYRNRPRSLHDLDHELSAPRAHGPAWRTPRLPVQRERQRLEVWQRSEMINGLRIAVRTLDPEVKGVSLTGVAYRRLSALDGRVPPLGTLGKAARRLGITAEAMRDQARHDVLQELARGDTTGERSVLSPEDVASLAPRRPGAPEKFTYEELIDGLCIALGELERDECRLEPSGMHYAALAGRDARVPRSEILRARAKKFGTTTGELIERARQRLAAQGSAQAQPTAFGTAAAAVPKPRPPRRVMSDEEVLDGLCIALRELETTDSPLAPSGLDYWALVERDPRVPSYDRLLNRATKRGISLRELIERGREQLAAMNEMHTDNVGHASDQPDGIVAALMREQLRVAPGMTVARGATGRRSQPTMTLEQVLDGLGIALQTLERDGKPLAIQSLEYRSLWESDRRVPSDSVLRWYTRRLGVPRADLVDRARLRLSEAPDAEAGV